MMNNITTEQRAKLAEGGQILTELSGLALKMSAGSANPCEERRAAELAADAAGVLKECSTIIRAWK